MAGKELPAPLKKSLESSKAKYVRVGKSGLQVSVPIFGAMSLGPKEWAEWLIEEEEVSFCALPPRFCFADTNRQPIGIATSESCL